MGNFGYYLPITWKFLSFYRYIIWLACTQYLIGTWCLAGLKLNGIQENAWHRSFLKRSLRRDRRMQSQLLKLKVVKASSTFSVHLKSLRMMKISMKMLYDLDHNSFLRNNWWLLTAYYVIYFIFNPLAGWGAPKSNGTRLWHWVSIYIFCCQWADLLSYNSVKALCLYYWTETLISSSMMKHVVISW